MFVNNIEEALRTNICLLFEDFLMSRLGYGMYKHVLFVVYFFAMHVYANVKKYLVTRVLISRLEFPEHQASYPLK